MGLPVLISPATGVKQHFYLRFANWLAGRGHAVLVVDDRGMGLRGLGHRDGFHQSHQAPWPLISQELVADA